MEYFAACRLCRLMLENRATLNGPVPINGEVHLFLNHLLTLEPKAGTGPPFDPPPGFVWVPPGEFILGGEDGLDRHIDRLEEGIFVARTPVTNAQYTRFMEAGGYKHKRLRYWTEEGWKWRKKEKQTQPRYWDDASFNEPEQPVVGVNWHEAVAYCRWLAQTLTLRPGYAVRLPMEQEWEKATRGYDGREYPWNGEWIEARCNTEELGLGKPSPVGRFSPQGDSPYGLWDATGNVWEWTLGGNSALRVLRGGSWVDSRWFARCACQSWSGPSTRWRNVGFRPVIAPSPPVSGL
jgi:formylglycine-generating enzyme required for sulfatase activity